MFITCHSVRWIPNLYELQQKEVGTVSGRVVTIVYYGKLLVPQKSFIRRLVIMEKAPNRAFSWLKAATTAFTFKTLLCIKTLC